MLLELTEARNIVLKAFEHLNKTGQQRALSVLKFLLNEGLRFEEVKNIDRWQLLANGRFILRTAKRGDTREFESSDVPISLQYSIQERKNVFCPFSYSSLLSIWNNAISNNIKGSKVKNIKLHIFRHLYIKQMYANGYTANDISIKLGLRSAPTALHYINSTHNIIK